jgi:putative transposase
VKVARAHARTVAARRDFHHKLSTTLIRENQAVYVEDLAVNGLTRTWLAKSVHDAGRTFARIGRFVPLSQTSSVCFVIDGPKPLNVRTWTCEACSTTHDRDVNAARIVLAAGEADKQNAYGG